MQFFGSADCEPYPICAMGKDLTGLSRLEKPKSNSQTFSSWADFP